MYKIICILYIQIIFILYIQVINNNINDKIFIFNFFFKI